MAQCQASELRIEFETLSRSQKFIMGTLAACVSVIAQPQPAPHPIWTASQASIVVKLEA